MTEPAQPESAHPEPPLAHAVSRLPAFLHQFVTPEAVYGLVLYAAIVAAASDEAENAAEGDGASLTWNDATITISDAAGVLIWVVLSMIVFWGAHVFAHAVAGHGVRNGRPVSVANATSMAFQHSSGMLYAPILPDARAARSAHSASFPTTSRSRPPCGSRSACSACSGSSHSSRSARRGSSASSVVLPPRCSDC